MKCKGFTLIEVVVAIAILAVIFSFVYTSFHSSIRIMGDAEESVYTSNVAEGVAEQLYYDITSTFKSDTDMRFTGKETSLRFLTTYRLLPPDEEEADFILIEYQLARDPESDEYILMRKEGERSRKIVGDIEAFEFNFYDGLEWKKEWNSKSLGKLPAGVRIRIARKNKKEILIHIPITAS